MRPRTFARRSFLATAGTTVGLPLLASLLSPRARAAAAATPRLIVFFSPCGFWMPSWTPDTTGSDYQLSPTLASLAKVKKKLLVLAGIDNDFTSGCNHQTGTGAFLTNRMAGGQAGRPVIGVSMDQVAAAKLGQSTRIKSMQLGSAEASCSSDCVFQNNISWVTESQPLPKVTDVRVVFDQLFAGADPSATVAERAQRLRLKKSVLDYVLDRSNRLAMKIGSSDRRKLDEYLTGVRALEAKLTAVESSPSCSTALSRPDQAIKPATPEHVRMMLDLTVLALRCDATRVITYMIARGGSGFDGFPWIGVTGNHHNISHHGTQQDLIDKLKKIDAWNVSQLAYLLEQLDAVVDEGAGTLLDQTLVFFSSEVEDGDAHRQTNKPIVLAGGAALGVNTGRHVRYSGENCGNLFISMLGALGVPTTTFGRDGKRPVPGLIG